MPFALIVNNKVHELWNERPEVVDTLDIREVSPIVQVGWEVDGGNIVEPTPQQADPQRVASVLLSQAQQVVLYYFSIGEQVDGEWAAYLAELRQIKNTGEVVDQVWPTKPALPDGF